MQTSIADQASNGNQVQPISLVGRISQVLLDPSRSTSKDRSYFHVISSTGVRYECLCPYFSPVEVNDIVYGVIVLRQGQFRFIYPPFIQLGTDRQAIQHCFLSAINTQTPGYHSKYRISQLHDRDVAKLYDLLLKDAGSEEKINEYLISLSYQWVKCNNQKILDYLQRVLTTGQAKKLLYWWHNRRNMRRLYLLGLTDTEINACLNYLEELDAKSDPEHSNLYRDIYAQCRNNPYKLIPLSLEKCCELYVRQGKEPDQLQKSMGRIIRRLNEYTAYGWSGCPLSYFVAEHPEILTEGYLDTLEKEYRTVIELDTIYLEYPHTVEKTVYGHVKDRIKLNRRGTKTTSITLTDSQPNTLTNNSGNNSENDGATEAARIIEDLSLDYDYDQYTASNELCEEQKEAIYGGINDHICVITGGAGTGKTTVIKEIIVKLQSMKRRVILLSPTGKAVSHLRGVLGSAAVGAKPSTIHLLLKQYPHIVTARQAFFDDLVIDEVSMVTTSLMYQLFTRFQFPFRLVLVGDSNQLPPIGWGSFFEQLILSNRVPIYRLRTIHRVETFDGYPDGITPNSLRILQGDYQLQLANNFSLIPGNAQESMGHIASILSSALAQGIPCNQLTVITPFVEDVTMINKLYQMVYFPTDRCTKTLVTQNVPVDLGILGMAGNTQMNTGLLKSIEIGGRRFVVGDRVILIKNNYQINLFNGDDGTVIDITPNYLMVKFRDGISRPFVYKKTSINKYVEEGMDEVTIDLLLHAFCVTVHRFQGSETNYVIFYMPPRPNEFVNRNLIYTAVTRARRSIWIVGDMEQLKLGIIRQGVQRWDNLCRRLCERFPQYKIVDDPNGEP